MRQKEEGIKRIYVQLLLDDHDYEIDIWPSGNEPIYRNGVLVGQTTTACFGYTFKKQVCLGYVQNIGKHGSLNTVTNDYIHEGDFEVEICGIRYSAKVNLHSPNLPTLVKDFEINDRDRYQATRNK